MTSSVNFAIPQRDDDLLEASDANYYVSALIENQEQIKATIKSFNRSIEQGEYEQLVDQFDYFFPLIRFNNTYDVRLRINLFKSLFNGLESLFLTLQTHLSDLGCEPALAEQMAETNRHYSDLLLMYAYLLTGLANQFENHVHKKLRSAAPAQRGKRKAVESTADDDPDVAFWKEQRSQLLKLFYRLICLNHTTESGDCVPAIKFLWSPSKIDDGLKNRILSFACKLLESPEVGKASGKGVMYAVFQHVVRPLCVSWAMHKAVARALMELAPELDYFKTAGATTFPFMEAIFHVQAEEGELNDLVVAMIQFGSRLDTENSSAKSEASSRAFSLFLSSLAEQSPVMMHRNLAFIAPFLRCDPPILRNAVLMVYAAIILSHHTNGQPVLGENQVHTLFQTMMDHIADKSALVRARAFNLWTKLAKAEAIPPEQFRIGLLGEARRRLRDDSMMVRKAAAHLLTLLLSFNVFGGNLNFESLYQEFVEVKRRHVQLMQANPDTATYAFEELAHEAVGDEQMLLEQDRNSEFRKEAQRAEEDIARCVDALLFATEMEKALNEAIIGIRRGGSPNEIMEMMQLVCECFKFNLRGSQKILKKMFNLVWRKDSAIVEMVVDFGHKALFSQNENKRLSQQRTAQNLVEAITDSTDEERISLEEIIAQTFCKNGVDKLLLEEIWRYTDTDKGIEQRVSATRLIVVVAKANGGLVRPEVERLFNLYNASEQRIRIEVLRILTALSQAKYQRQEKGNGASEFCISHSDKFIQRMCTFLFDELDQVESPQWIPHCRQSVNVIYGACSRPNKIIFQLFNQLISKTQNIVDEVLDKLSAQRMEMDGQQTEKKRVEMEISTSRVLYFVGEVVLKFLSFAEMTFLRRLKDIKNTCERRGHSTPATSRTSTDEQEAEAHNDELEYGITEEERLQMRLQKILDTDTFTEDTIIGRTLPIVMLILENHSRWSFVVVESALLCLAKFMLVNQRCCRIFLAEFFKFFDHNASVRLRNNMLIMMADLCYRFPNVFNDFNQSFIKKIRDENSGVRYTSLLLCSHMLLTDQMKITANIAEIAFCIVDEEHNIETLAQGFFNEMSKKHNVLYNHMPAIMDRLINDRNLSELQLETVLRFLLQLIEKELQKERLVEKLVERFPLLEKFNFIVALRAEAAKREERKTPVKKNEGRKTPVKRIRDAGAKAPAKRK